MCDELEVNPKNYLPLLFTAPEEKLKPRLFGHQKLGFFSTRIQGVTDYKGDSLMEERSKIPAAVPAFTLPPLDIDPHQVIPEITFAPQTAAPTVILEDPRELKRVRALTHFKHFRTHNQIALCPMDGSWTPARYHTALGYAHLYLGKKKIPPSQMAITAICWRKPRKVLHHYKSVVQFERLQKGHYQSAGDPPVHVVVVPELQLSDRVYLWNFTRVIALKAVYLLQNLRSEQSDRTGNHRSSTLNGHPEPSDVSGLEAEGDSLMEEKPKSSAAATRRTLPPLDIGLNQVIPSLTFPPPTREPMVILEDSQELMRIRTLTPFKHFRTHNLLTFGPFYGSWTPADYHHALGQAHLYMGEAEISPSQMTITVLCESKPRKVLHRYQSIVQFERIRRGHYQSPGAPLVHVVVGRELEPAEWDYFWLIRSVFAHKFVCFLYDLPSEI